MLAKKGITVLPTESDEGNVDCYILSNRLAVERRTGSSFLKGIVDRTLFTSAVYLREHFEIPKKSAGVGGEVTGYTNEVASFR